MSRVRSAARWLMEPAPRGWVAVLFVMLVAAAGAAAYRIVHDEHATCTIQARGLPAGHELATSMADIHALLTIKPTSKAQKLAAKQTPAATLAIVSDLNMHLAKYQTLEAGQPKSRSC